MDFPIVTATPLARRQQIIEAETDGPGPLDMYLNNLAPGPSRVSMQSMLNRVAHVMHESDRCVQTKIIIVHKRERLSCDCAAAVRWERLDANRVEVLKAALADRFAPATVNKALMALRGVLKAAWRMRLIDTEDYHRAIDTEPVKGETLPTGRAISKAEAVALFAACSADPTPAGSRDAAAFALMYGAGLRRAEVAALHLTDYDSESGAVVIMGKGNKQRKVYALGGIAAALNEWMQHRGTGAGPLLHPVSKAGDVRHERPISGQAIMGRLRVRCQQAAVDPCTPHDLRRSFVSELLAAGADVLTVQKLAGHARAETTERYDRRPDEQARKAAALVHVPYIPK